MCAALAAALVALAAVMGRTGGGEPPPARASADAAPPSAAAARGGSSLADEGVAVTNAGAWHAAGFRGAGIPIAVVDSSFKGWEQLVPPGQWSDQTLQATEGRDRCDLTASSHGTAVAQIVRDMAPDARLYLVCVRTPGNLYHAEDLLRGLRVKVVVQSLSWFNGSQGGSVQPPEGSPEAVAAAAEKSGILWVNSAGNFPRRHWTGTFVDTDGDRWHNFTPSDEGNSLRVDAGEELCAYLKWNDWPSSSQNFNLHLYPQVDNERSDNVGGPGQTLVPLVQSENLQDGRDPPVEAVCYRNELKPPQARDVFLAIHGVKATGTPRFDLFVTRSELQYSTPEASVAEPATSPAVLAVGAACWKTSQVEPYSSRGPTMDGRTKPDLVGPDSVSSPFPEFGAFTECGTSGFRGSSAATPYVGAAAALVLQRYPSWTPKQVRAYLEQNAVDLGPQGKDNDSGAGMVRLPPLAAPPPPPPPASPPALRVAKVRISPMPLRPGVRVRVRASVTADGAAVGQGQVACSAGVGKDRLRLRAARLRHGVAECVWTVPRGTAGRVLRGSVRATYHGVSARKEFRARVRRARA